METAREMTVLSEDVPFKMFVFEGKDKKYFRKKHFLHFVEIFALFEGSLEFCIDNLY